MESSYMILLLTVYKYEEIELSYPHSPNNLSILMQLMYMKRPLSSGESVPNILSVYAYHYILLNELNIFVQYKDNGYIQLIIKDLQIEITPLHSYKRFYSIYERFSVNQCLMHNRTHFAK